MRLRLLLLIALIALLAGGVAHEALAGRDATGKSDKTKLTASQKAARAKLLATAKLLEKNKLSCGCRHHFPAPKP